MKINIQGIYMNKQLFYQPLPVIHTFLKLHHIYRLYMIIYNKQKSNKEHKIQVSNSSTVFFSMCKYKKKMDIDQFLIKYVLFSKVQVICLMVINSNIWWIDLHVNNINYPNIDTLKIGVKSRFLQLSQILTSCKISSLAHEVWNYTMKSRVFEAISFFASAQSAEVLTSLWSDICAELEKCKISSGDHFIRQFLFFKTLNYCWKR